MSDEGFVLESGALMATGLADPSALMRNTATAPHAVDAQFVLGIYDT